MTKEEIFYECGPKTEELEMRRKKPAELDVMLWGRIYIKKTHERKSKDTNYMNKQAVPLISLDVQENDPICRSKLDAFCCVKKLYKGRITVNKEIAVKARQFVEFLTGRGQKPGTLSTGIMPPIKIDMEKLGAGSGFNELIPDRYSRKITML